MSELRANTITASDGTSAVTLTKQSAAKHFITYNISQAVTSSLNNSSITDVGTGNHRYNFANNFNTAEGYTCGGVMAWNTDQTTNVYSVQPLNKNDVLTSSLEVSTNYAGGTNDYYYNCSTSHGDLA